MTHIPYPEIGQAVNFLETLSENALDIEFQEKNFHLPGFYTFFAQSPYQVDTQSGFFTIEANQQRDRSHIWYLQRFQCGPGNIAARSLVEGPEIRLHRTKFFPETGFTRYGEHAQTYEEISWEGLKALPLTIASLTAIPHAESESFLSTYLPGVSREHISSSHPAVTKPDNVPGKILYFPGTTKD